MFLRVNLKGTHQVLPPLALAGVCSAGEKRY
jgi:hypothetical protein